MFRSLPARLLGGIVLTLVMVLGVAGAGVSAQDATPSASTSAVASDFPVQITFVSAMTSLDAVDVYINGDDKDQRVVEGLKYGTTSEQFIGTAPGTVIVVKQNRNLRLDLYLYNTLVPTSAGNNYVVVISDFMILPVQLDTSKSAGASFLSVREAGPHTVSCSGVMTHASVGTFAKRRFSPWLEP